MGRKECLRLNAILALLTTDSAEEFKNAYKVLTGVEGASIIFYLNKLGENIK